MNRINLTADGGEYLPSNSFFQSEEFKRIHETIKHLGGVTSPNIDYAPMNYPGLNSEDLVRYCTAVLRGEKKTVKRKGLLYYSSAEHEGIKVGFASDPLCYSAIRK